MAVENQALIDRPKGRMSDMRFAPTEQTYSSNTDPSNKILNETDDWQGLLLDLLDGVTVLAERLRLIVSATLLAGVAAYGVAYFWLPKVYTSVAYLGPFDEPTAKQVESIIQSPPVLDPVIADFPKYRSGQTLERKRDRLNSNLHWQVLKASPSTSAIYTLRLDDTDPRRAQAMLSAIIDHWLEAERPRPDTSFRLGKTLEASEAQAADLSQVIAELKKRPDTMFADARNGYFPPNIVDMIKMRTETAARIVDLTIALRAGSRDMIFSPASLPEQPSGPNGIRIVVIVMAVTLGGLMVFFLLRHRLATLAREPVYEPAIARIRRAMPQWRAGRRREQHLEG